MPGKSKEDAFRIGHEIADAITARNPKPMKMKFEKVRASAILSLADGCLTAPFLSSPGLPAIRARRQEALRR
jgi:hypothetical protein